MKNIRDFLSINDKFLEVKFSIYLNRRVFVMLYILYNGKKKTQHTTLQHIIKILQRITISPKNITKFLLHTPFHIMLRPQHIMEKAQLITLRPQYFKNTTIYKHFITAYIEVSTTYIGLTSPYNVY